jgi:hypothetical protein
MNLNYVDYKITADLKKIFLVTNEVSGWRYSAFADYYIFDTVTKLTKPLQSSKSSKTISNSIGSGLVSLLVLSPTGNNVAWVRDNDLFFTYNGTEYQITNDGSRNIINGISDWVYEEEVFSSNIATWISNDGTAIAFLKFDDTKVREYELQFYAKMGENSYPEQVDLKYPKAGTENPLVDLYITVLDKNLNVNTAIIEFGSDCFKRNDRLFTQINWIDQNSSFLVRIMNRIQNKQKLYLVSHNTEKNVWVPQLIRDEKTIDGSWYELRQPLHVVKHKNENPRYIEIMENDDGFAHIAYFKDIFDKKPVWITSGSYEVTNVNSINVDSNKMYLIG